MGGKYAAAGWLCVYCGAAVIVLSCLTALLFQRNKPMDYLSNLSYWWDLHLLWAAALLLWGIFLLRPHV
jgi:ABC-type transport system involved in multi-copper enzyme maturation permease subunit